MKAALLTLSLLLLLPPSVHGGPDVLQVPDADAAYQDALQFLNQQTPESYQQAVEYFTKAARLYEQQHDRAHKAICFGYAGSVCQTIGQPHDALEYYQEARALWKQLGDRAAEGTTLSNIGLVYADTGQPQQALWFFYEALPLQREFGDRRGAAATLNGIGIVCARSAQPQDALPFFQQALALENETGDKRENGATLTAIGLVYSDTRQPEQALQFLQQALSVWQELGDKHGEAVTLNSIGVVYQEAGQPQQSLEYYQQALPLLTGMGDKDREATTLSSIGLAQLQLGQPQQALQYFQQVLPLRRELRDKAGEAAALTGIAHLDAETGQPQEALDSYQQSLALWRGLGDQRTEAASLDNIGAVYSRIGQPLQALQSYQQALALQKQTGDQHGEAITLNDIGEVYSRIGLPGPALDSFSQSVALAEQVRLELDGQPDLQPDTLQPDDLPRYQAYVDLLLKQSSPAAAFATAEKARAGALLNMMLAARVDLDRSLTPEERQQEQDLRDRLAPLSSQRLAAAGDADGLAAPTQQATAEADLQAYMNTLYARHPEMARRAAIHTLTLSELASLLPQDTALLEYVTLRVDAGKQKTDRTVLFCITTEDGKPVLNVYSINRPEEEIAERVQQFADACSHPDRLYRTSAKDLYQLLIAPAEKALVGKKRLIICPDGALWDLPFQALVSDNNGKEHFLAEQYQVSYAYSATALQAAFQEEQDPKRQHPSHTMLALANPDFGAAPSSSTAGRAIWADSRFALLADSRGLFNRDGGILPLPHTQDEADAIRKDFPDASILTGKDALASTAVKDGGNYRYLHFATHGYFNDAPPMQSAIILAAPRDPQQTQTLTARDIFDLNWPADLVVLSACQTGQGEKRPGEGLVGLTWALFSAGATSQVVSQWSVNDASTALLMQQFYQDLRAGKGKAASLQHAELTLMHDGTHSHPFYWAPFILTGDWR